MRPSDIVNRLRAADAACRPFHATVLGRTLVLRPARDDDNGGALLARLRELVVLAGPAAHALEEGIRIVRESLIQVDLLAERVIELEARVLAAETALALRVAPKTEAMPS